MKRLISVLLFVLILCGCTGEVNSPSESADTSAEVSNSQSLVESEESSVPWARQVGVPWDAEGALTEIPLTVPDGIHYSTAIAFDGDLLLWSYDPHRKDGCSIELCLIELDDGTVAAVEELSMSQQIYPQVIEDRLYFCDSSSGNVVQLDKTLKIVKSWETTPYNGSWFMGANETLYIYDWDGKGFTRDLKTDEEIAFMDGADISRMYADGNTATVEYHSQSTGELSTAVLDLTTGDITQTPRGGAFTSAAYHEDTWLYCVYRDSNIYYLQNGENTQFVDLGADSLRFLNDGTLFRASNAGTSLSLHSKDGTALASCNVSETSSPGCRDIIWNEANDGYFCLVSEDYTSYRLLFWDVKCGNRGEDISFTVEPEADEAQAQLEAKALKLSEKYGVNVLVGTECDTQYLDFTTIQITDLVDVSSALDELEIALASYPDGFFNQLRYGSIREIEIQLVGTLEAVDAEAYPGSYAAFALDCGSYSLIAADIYTISADTWRHEFSHLIDAYLQWDSEQRDDALFSETVWLDLNPDWFTGYSYQYGDEHELHDSTSFVDSYSTVKPTEDRARIMEYSMMSVNTFEGCDVLLAKLAYYSACIRNAFDTTGWPETTLWEQYL